MGDAVNFSHNNEGFSITWSKNSSEIANLLYF